MLDGGENMNMYYIIAAAVNLDPMNKDNVLKSLEIMWKGVLAIFLTIAIILFVSWGINTLCNKARAAIDKKRADIAAKTDEDGGNGENKTE